MLRGAVAVALVCALGGSAYADNKDAAKESYNEGKRHYDLGEYEPALTAFKKAYLNYEEPVFLFNIAQCYRALGDRPAAVRTYRAFLRNWPKAPNREQVDRIIAELDAAIAHDEAARTTPPQDTLAPARPAEAPRPQPDAARAEAAHAPAAAGAPPGQRPVEPTPAPNAATKAPATAASAPAVRPHDDLEGMVEVVPNFDRPSGSSKPLKWWAWTLIAVAVGGVAAAAIVVGITQSSEKFDTSLPQFNVNNMGLRAVGVRF